MGQICNQSQVQKGLVTDIKEIYQQDQFQPVSEQTVLDKVQEVFSEFKGQENYNYLRSTQNLQFVKHKQKDEYYLGDWKGGEMKGTGYLTVPHKYAYCGEFDHKPHGKGKVIFYEKNITYQGQMNQGLIEGQGIITENNGLYDFNGKIYNSKPKQGTVRRYHPQTKQKIFTAYLHGFPDLKATIDYFDQKHYEGQINTRTFLPEGTGFMLYPNKNKYEGEWQAGSFHGKGTFTWESGCEYTGEYVKGVKEGRGKMTFESKNYYQGEWLNGKQNGQGTLYNSNDQIIQTGEWKNGQYVEDSAAE